MAWVYTQYASEPEYFAAERLAKVRPEGGGRRGLWSQPNAIPPWVFRHPERGQGATPEPRLAAKGLGSGRCGTKRFCKQMATCDEARYFLKVCGVKQLDGDGDGRPCEALCQ